MNLESVDVTAGLGGFLAFFVLAVALYFLMRNMNARLRRMSYRQQQEAKAAAQASLHGEPCTSASMGGPSDGSDLG
jgi:predicted lipid-binding transport protein (Tim44 family)